MAKRPAINPDPPVAVTPPATAEDGTGPAVETPAEEPEPDATRPLETEVTEEPPLAAEYADIPVCLLCTLDDGNRLHRAGTVITVAPERAAFLLERGLARRM